MLLSEMTARFVLHPELDPANYKITGTMRDCSKWMAMTYAGDDRADAGEMYGVHYVMLSLSTNYIIPISRADEHHQGMDLLYDFQDGTYLLNGKRRNKKLNINPSDFYPIGYDGRCYLYNKSDAAPLMQAATKFLQYGGPDGILTTRQDFPSQRIHLSDFIKSNGTGIVDKSGGLLPGGQRIYDTFQTLAEMIRKAGQDSDRIQTAPIFVYAAKMLKAMSNMAYELAIPYDKLGGLVDGLKTLQKNNDLRGLEEYIFGFHGVKNMIHVALKKSRDNSYSRETAESFWGDVDLAIDMLSRI